MGKSLDPKVAEKVMLKAGLKPLEPYKKGNSKWKCIHLKCGNVVYPRYSDVKKSDGTLRTGCIPCGYLKMKIPNKEAVALMQKSGFTPLEPYKSAHTPWKCKCNKCGSTVTPKYINIKQGKICKVCSRTKSLADPKKIASIMKKRKLKPLELYVNNKTKWKCECLRCGKIVYPTFSSVQNLSKNSTGCMDCGRKQLRESNTTPEKIAKSVMLAAKLKPLEPFQNSG